MSNQEILKLATDLFLKYVNCSDSNKHTEITAEIAIRQARLFAAIASAEEGR